MELKLHAVKHMTWVLHDNYPEMAEEARMSPKQLLEEGYEYDELIHRKEVPIVDCMAQRDGNVMKVFCKTSHGIEYIGYTEELFDLPARTKLIIDGGQYIKIVEGEYRDKKVQVNTPYEYILSVKPL